MSYESLPGVQLQLPQYHFQATPVQPRPNIWPTIIQGIAQLAKTAEENTPEARERKKLENMELRFKTGVFAKQLENMQHGDALDAEGLPMYKPDGTPYSYAEKQEMKARAQEMEQRDLTIKALKNKLTPSGKTSGANDAWAPKQGATSPKTTAIPALPGTPTNPNWLASMTAGSPEPGVDTVDPNDISNYSLHPPSKPTSSLFDPIPQFIPDTTPEDYHSALNNEEVLAA